MQPKNMSELSILIPDESISLRDVVISMRPCKVKQLKEILGVISKYIDKIAETEDTIELAKYILSDSGEQGLKDIYLVLRSTTNVDKDETFDNLLYDELVLLVVKFLEMNKDFFKRVGEKLKPTIEESKPSQKNGGKLSPV